MCQQACKQENSLQKSIWLICIKRKVCTNAYNPTRRIWAHAQLRRMLEEDTFPSFSSDFRGRKSSLTFETMCYETYLVSFFLKLIYFLIGGWFLYRILLFSVKPQHESGVGTYVSLPFEPRPQLPPPTPLGWSRAPVWVSWDRQRIRCPSWGARMPACVLIFIMVGASWEEWVSTLAAGSLTWAAWKSPEAPATPQSN